MGSKSDMIIEYIERLPVGARISVRGLSRELGVSDGTAYKALKLAEERGLVETRPRAGTVRKQDIKLPRSLSVEAARLGLEVLSGAANMDFPVTKLVLGDVSVQQLSDKLRGGGRGVLCVVGDRPDIFAFAAQHGISLLITGGVHPGEAVLREVEGFYGEHAEFGREFRAERYRIALNGTPVAPDDESGWYCDRSLRCLPNIEQGEDMFGRWNMPFGRVKFCTRLHLRSCAEY